VPLAGAIRACTVPEIEFAGVDLVVLAVPCNGLPAALGEIGARVGERSAVLVASKGLVPPLGTTPSAYVSERVRARAVASLAGPAHAREAIELGASVVVATRDRDLRRQLREVLDAGGLTVEATDDVTGTELAAAAKNAAALASAAAAARGANLAGAAAGHVFSEVHALAVASGGRSETFAGLAGAGDLVATAIASGSRNRRAGELVGAGVPVGQVEATVQQTAESLATVPLLTEAFARQGIDAPVTTGLGRVLDGESSPEQWLESVRSAKPGRRTRAA
jgi:glycerol-3-phosphate dehydrogenase (NAD(P)+)